ncbi:hypothetical protein CONLIGDRAFT_635146 [Coniochaeta ligniaria NRRL 30616]|uniref:F-box domain-containing protein n=1 Tax=Coniochaeta ligniaria NRRL 30616 TaxID=1408157 RepID=A0A1J7IGS6_9PEZI|nr:hypothetical protein CONLIGDRAFT_635146 [Coniochaeta ligniaria NRRL 30616]
MPTTSPSISTWQNRSEADHDTSHTTVTLALQRRWRRVKDWYMESYPTCDTGRHEPPWVSARRPNLANCRFYQLPDELILQILGDLDYVSKAIARRTCGLLLGISFDQTLFPQPFGSRSLNDIRVWPPFEQPAWSIPFEAGDEMRALRKQVDRLLDRDRFCDPCRQFREDGRYEKAMQALQGTLWCSHCNSMHKRPLFSAHQRDVPSATRICVLAEGKAPFCAHRSIGWDCTQNAASDRIETCRHPDHDRPVRAWYTCLKDALNDHQPSNREYQRPRLEFRPPFNDSPRATLQFETTFLLFHLHHRGGPVTRAWLQEQLTAKAPALNKMLCPHVTARDGQLLLPFGPDHCACFGCPRWIGHVCSPADSYFCCRCNAPKDSSGREGCFLPDEYDWRHAYRCAICHATYRWRRCGSAVFLEIDARMGTYDWALSVRRLPHSQRLMYWLYRLHPESWGILDDEELRHVAWCDDVHCMSRWRWESLSRLWEDA